MTESRQEKLDRTAKTMPASLMNGGLLAVAASPDVFFKTLGWYQWSKKNELTESEKVRFKELYEQAYKDTQTPGVKRNEIERLINLRQN